MKEPRHIVGVSVEVRHVEYEDRLKYRTVTECAMRGTETGELTWS